MSKPDLACQKAQSSFYRADDDHDGGSGSGGGGGSGGSGKDSGSDSGGDGDGDDDGYDEEDALKMISYYSAKEGTQTQKVIINHPSLGLLLRLPSIL